MVLQLQPAIPLRSIASELMFKLTAGTLAFRRLHVSPLFKNTHWVGIGLW